MPPEYSALPGVNTNTATEYQHSNTITPGRSTSGFNLVKVVTPDKLYCIDLAYEDEYYTYYTPASTYVTANGLPQSSGPTDPVGIGFANFIFQKSAKIKTITSNSLKEKVDFVSSIARQDFEITYTAFPIYNNIPKRLDQVVFTNNAGVCKNFAFGYDYFQDSYYSNTVYGKRLKLTQVQERSCDFSINVPSYKFNYVGDNSNVPTYFPIKFSHAVDHWGFHNGINNNNSYNINVPPTTQRNPSHFYCQQGSLVVLEKVEVILYYTLPPNSHQWYCIVDLLSHLLE